MLPPEPEIHDRARCVGLARLVEAGPHHGAVDFAIAYRAKSEPEWMLDQAGQRGLDELGYLPHLG